MLYLIIHYILLIQHIINLIIEPQEMLFNNLLREIKRKIYYDLLYCLYFILQFILFIYFIKLYFLSLITI
jgi:hypothetical protein